jgi:hypothetical protein
MGVSSISHKRGFELDNYPGSCAFVLVKAEVANVSHALAALLQKPLIEDVYRNYENINIDQLLIWQYINHSWTLFGYEIRKRDEVCKQEIPQAISASLNTDCICFEYEKVSGWHGYRLFRNGEVVETYSFGIDYRPDWIEFHYGSAGNFPEETDHGIPWNINTTDEKGYQFLFRSTLQSVLEDAVKNPKVFLNSLFIGQDAWLPSSAYMPSIVGGVPPEMPKFFVRVDLVEDS